MTEHEFIEMMKAGKWEIMRLSSGSRGPILTISARFQIGVQLFTKSGKIELYSGRWPNVEIKDPANKDYIHSLFYDKIGREMGRFREMGAIIDKVRVNEIINQRKA